MDQEKANATVLDIEMDLAEIRKSLLQAIKDVDKAQVTLLLENGADANSKDNWGPALTQAIGWENLTIVVENALLTDELHNGVLAPITFFRSS